MVVAGVAGGVGTSTWARLWQAAHRIAVHDAGHYTNGLVDVLVSSNTAASTSRIGWTLNVLRLNMLRELGHYRPPVLVVMHTVPGVVLSLNADLIAVRPHLTEILEIWHKPDWLALPQPPGDPIPRHKDITATLNALPGAIASMYSEPALSALPQQSAGTQPPLRAMPGMQPQIPAHQLGPGLAGAHPAIRAGPPFPPAPPTNGASHQAVHRGQQR